uniref:Uncharacterized protein n=1 Tax=Falco tinnunculus TaxID=100819 RepID=A0A8C4U4P6_FALTI
MASLFDLVMLLKLLLLDLTCHSRKEECCLCWCLLFISEQNCSCFPCPYKDKPCQHHYHPCTEHANCWWCCCFCSNDPGCKCCCSGGNSGCQYYESGCCRSAVNEQHHSRTPGVKGSVQTIKA